VQTKMTAAQIREIKPHRYWMMPLYENGFSMSDYEFVFSKDSCYKINIQSGETFVMDYGGVFNDYSKIVEGIPDNVEVMVDLDVYRAWLDTKEVQ